MTTILYRYMHWLGLLILVSNTWQIYGSLIRSIVYLRPSILAQIILTFINTDYLEDSNTQYGK